ncbi:MAG TPA: ATP-binding protein [Terriglobales bacterium]|nr:ATP-binding protein [Terriglobales bacterium]
MSVWPGLATMKPNTAAAFLLTGLALVRRNGRDLRLYSLAVALVGTLTLIEYVARLSFGIDELLFRDPYSPIDPGRMSQITSVAFTLLGPALALMSSRSSTARTVARRLSAVVGCMGFIAILGYSYDTQALYQVRPYSSVALHTAIGFVVAALGVQCVNPSEGIISRVHADNAGGTMLRQLLPAALLVPYLLGFMAWLAHKRFGWEMGFSLALVVAATVLCLIVTMLINARRLEREDLALREMNRTLDERVAQRTEELAAQIQERERIQAVLDSQRAQMIAASKLTSLGEMAGGLAHEINSPLNIIQARASDLQEIAQAGSSLDSSNVVKATASILRTSERIMSVVRGLRTFARDGRADPFEKTSVQTIVEDTLALCRERFSALGITVEVHGLQADLSIECQRVQISQVLLNLLNNAFDAVQSLTNKWIRVDVSTDADSLSIAVTDSGHGIPREIAEKAMQPFFTTKPVGKGTGLGLSISNAIAEAHHGRVWIDSRGPNTRVVLSLPKTHFSHADGADHGQADKQNAAVC